MNSLGTQNPNVVYRGVIFISFNKKIEIFMKTGILFIIQCFSIGLNFMSHSKGFFEINNSLRTLLVTGIGFHLIAPQCR